MDNNKFNIAEAKKHFSEIINRVSYGKERITITKRGKPLAMIVPTPMESGLDHPSYTKGWLENDDPFFKIVNQIVKNRKKHLARIFKSKKG